jgi:sugar lactone lactonase YvrE
MILMQTRFYDNKLKAVVARLVGGQRRIFLVTAMLMALVLVGTVAASVNFVLKWGSPGSGDGEFAAGGGPGGVAVDAAGNVYVVDVFNHRIQKFDSNGNFITKWGGFGFGDGQFYYPYALAVDASGMIFVADAFNYRIQKFDSNGNFLGKWGSQGSGDGEFNFPASVAVDTSGNVYVADLFNTRIQKFDSNGSFLAKWGSQGIADGQFNQALGVAADASGNVYVADAVNQNVQKFDSDGNFITRWGSPGSGIGEFAAPSGLAVDASSNVYVVDVNNNRIQKFDSNGNFIDTWGSLGAGDGEFDRPYAVAVDAFFNVYVGELINDRIQKFNQLLPNQAPVVTITAPASGAIFAVGAPVNFSGTLADNAGDTHTAQWMFDNLAQAGTVNEMNGTVTATHVFATAGVYQVKLTVTDQLGASGTADTVGGLPAMVVIYDPSGGWVTGGGWIASPAGAYAANPSLTGKASFGFVSKYEHGAHMPTGQTEFQFKAGNLNFHSTSYDWLVVAGARAQYKGSGTINGAGDYAFMLTAIDGQINGGGGQDKFRIKIWSKDNGGVIYDNQMGGGDADNPTTALGGGSIVIHN